MIRACAGIAIDVSAGDSTVLAGGRLTVNVTVVNRSKHPFVLAAVASPLAMVGLLWRRVGGR